MEVWKNISGFDGLYKVSNFGRVKSTDRITVDKNGKSYRRKGIILSQIKRVGRLYVALGRGNTFLVHRLVANAFISNDLGSKEVNHIDGNPHNNVVENLEWCTRSENMLHAYRTGLRTKQGKGVVQITTNGDIVREFRTVAEASRETGVSRSHIGECCNNGKYRHTAGGFNWKFS